MDTTHLTSLSLKEKFYGPKNHAITILPLDENKLKLHQNWLVSKCPLNRGSNLFRVFSRMKKQSSKIVFTIKDIYHFVNHIKTFCEKLKVERCCTALPLFRESPALITRYAHSVSIPIMLIYHIWQTFEGENFHG